MKPPIYTGAWGKCHIQGIAVDEQKGYIYYSFTTKLVKSTLDGQIVGYVDGLMGHLGCIAFNPDDGRVYGSLEYKNDAIGKGILNNLGSSEQLEDAFYIAIFDVDKIDRPDMDAEKDGIMTSVYLQEAVKDYTGTGVDRQGNVVPHRYGCSGIDGTTFGPMFGAPEDSKKYLFVCYGVYGDVSRGDNDHQVILCYDTENWAQYETELSQSAMHKNGPAAPDRKFFVYTGNTNWGVQNLEYDANTNTFLMAVYRGQKESFPNYTFFAVDASKAPVKGELKGVPYQAEGEILTLAEMGEIDEKTGVRGWNYRYGTTGMHSFGDGYFYVSYDGRDENGWDTNVKLCRWNDEKALEPVEE